MFFIEPPVAAVCNVDSAVATRRWRLKETNEKKLLDLRLFRNQCHSLIGHRQESRNGRIAKIISRATTMIMVFRGEKPQSTARTQCRSRVMSYVRGRDLLPSGLNSSPGRQRESCRPKDSSGSSAHAEFLRFIRRAQRLQQTKTLSTAQLRWLSCGSPNISWKREGMRAAVRWSAWAVGNVSTRTMGCQMRHTSRVLSQRGRHLDWVPRWSSNGLKWNLFP